MEPVLMTKRYGRCDYERFEHITSPLVAGRGEIGKIKIDCRFSFTKSQWGVLGRAGNPAGIIFLDLNFHQPPGSKLRSATISVTLEDEKGTQTGACPVKLTDYFGPKQFRGPETHVQEKSSKSFTPSAEAFGFGAGGVGFNKEKIVQTANRWKFTGSMVPSEDSIWYDTLCWNLEENPQETQSMQPNQFHTAFAFEHNAKKFYMRVEVRGKLAHTSDRFKSKVDRAKKKLLKFGGGPDKEQETVSTMFEWKNGYRHTKQLDRIARGLPRAMELENFVMNVPVEFPNALAADFSPVVSDTSTTQPYPQTLEESSGMPLGISQQTTMMNESLLGMGDPFQHDSEPSLESMSMAAGLIMPAPRPSPPTIVSNSMPLPIVTAPRTPATPAVPIRRGRYQTSESSNDMEGTTLADSVEVPMSRDRGSSPKAKEAEVKPQAKNHPCHVAVELDLLLLVQWSGLVALAIVGFVAEMFGFPFEWWYESPPPITQEKPEKETSNGMAKTDRQQFMLPSEPPDDSDAEPLVFLQPERPKHRRRQRAEDEFGYVMRRM
ncbi:hypothetical protein B0H63DRAFT_459713 [Podospora didyma]|uniref:Uncharacterized protein n=1 Tax=Podospora didyma TaxID=330526 RepID=A0AAE0P669_9PEZI|nr:hypothetical protein B0H63DRAFT_459713 [Podospora didyma]